MDYQNIIVTTEGPLALVRVNRPAKLNSLNLETLAELETAFTTLAGDDAVRVVIVSGEGRAFIAGADVRVMQDMTPLAARDFALRGQAVLARIEQLGQPVIAAINGLALGGGCELAMACDLRYAADTARIGQTEVALGLIPGFAGTQRLARLCGVGVARELILTGEPVDAATAQAIGLVNRVFPAASLMDEVRKIALRIAAMGPDAVRLAKAAVNRGIDASFATGCAYEAEAFGICFSRGQPREGITALLEKRAPEWK